MNIQHIVEMKNVELSTYKDEIAFELRLELAARVNNLITTNTFNMAILVALSTLGIKAGDNTHRIYFLSGDIVSMLIQSNVLSIGWK